MALLVSLKTTEIKSKAVRAAKKTTTIIIVLTPFGTVNAPIGTLTGVLLVVDNKKLPTCDFSILYLSVSVELPQAVKYIVLCRCVVPFPNLCHDVVKAV